MGLLWKTENYIVDKCSTIRIPPIYKLATKLLKIKDQSQMHKSSSKLRRKTIQKIQIFHKNMYKGVYDFPTPH